MKILITNLLLIAGLGQVLARSLPWISPTLDVHDAWMDDDYDLFRLPSIQPNDDFYNFMMDSEEAKEVDRAAESAYQSDHHAGFFGTLLGSFLKIQEEDANSNENTQSKSNEKTENVDQSNKLFNIILNGLFDADEENLSKEKTNFIANEKKSSEEIEPIKSKEDGNEVTPILEVNIFDLTKSSEEKQRNNEDEDKSSEEKFEENSNEAIEVTDLAKSSDEHRADEAENDLLETDVNELVSFFIALDLLNDMGAVIENHETKDDIARGKEVDEILKLISSALEGGPLQSKPIISSEKRDDKILKTTTATNESDEDDDSNETTTTPKNYSNEKIRDDNESDSSEEEDSNFVNVVFKGFDEDSEQQMFNQHKYSVINTQQEFMTTSAPYVPEKSHATLSTTDAQNSINEYVEIRENLDTQQDSLKKHELAMDKDFYAIISNDLDDKNLHKFEKDIYAVQDNLDRIKKNINAMRNLQTKLFFYKLVTSAVKDMLNKSEN